MTRKHREVRQRRVPKKKGRRQSAAVLDRLVESADSSVLVDLIRRLAADSPEAERACLEYLQGFTAEGSDARADAAGASAYALWSQIEPDLAELDEYGGGSYDTENEVGSILYEFGQVLQKRSIACDDRRALLDEVLPYIRSGNSGMEDALYDVAYAACRDDQDLRDLAERFEALADDWPADHARRIYRRLGDRENYLRLRSRRMRYGADYHDLATFHWERGEQEHALAVAREGLEKGEGRMDELREFLAQRAKASGDRRGYLELRFAQATACPTLASYKAFRKLCGKREWAVYELRVLAAIENAREEEQLEVHMHRKEYDRAIAILSAIEYPDERYGRRRVLTTAARLEKEYPEQVLTFYLSGIPRLRHSATRDCYAQWALAARKARHMWIDVLKQPTKWEAFATELKSANQRRPAFQQEFTEAVPGWSRL